MAPMGRLEAKRAEAAALKAGVGASAQLMSEVGQRHTRVHERTLGVRLATGGLGVWDTTYDQLGNWVIGRHRPCVDELVRPGFEFIV